MRKQTLIAGFAILMLFAVSGWAGTLPAPQSTILDPMPPAAQASGMRAPAVAAPAAQPMRMVDPQGAPQSRRTKGRTAMIIGGSAGTGAAIGGIAKGGKGAAVGALSGAAAGFIYDRVTRGR
ncbi:MAG: hypothetical protein ACK5AZ_14760 [Bryobacteraceae bacterium]